MQRDCRVNLPANGSQAAKAKSSAPTSRRSDSFGNDRQNNDRRSGQRDNGRRNRKQLKKFIMELIQESSGDESESTEDPHGQTEGEPSSHAIDDNAADDNGQEDFP